MPHNQIQATCRLFSSSPKKGHYPPHIFEQGGANLLGSIGPVSYVFKSKVQDLGFPFLISKNLTGSCLSTVE